MSVVVFPAVKKAAFVVGASYGRGVITCRSGEDFGGPWNAPAMFALEGLSFGFQLGGQATDFVLLIMYENGANSVMTSKVKLGADASAAAGPVGRTTSAETDVVLKAEFLSWSRSRGLLGGMSLAGALHCAPTIARTWRSTARASSPGNCPGGQGQDAGSGQATDRSSADDLPKTRFLRLRPRCLQRGQVMIHRPKASKGPRLPC